MNWFSLSLQLNRFPIHKARAALEEIQRIPEPSYGLHIEKKKKEIVQYHLRNNAFYRRLFGGEAFVHWDQVPLMTKADLQCPLEERLSRGFQSKNSYVGKTSGSSGTPFIFAKDRFCHALSWAEFHDRYNWHGIDLDRSLQARFYGIPLDKLGYFRERLKDKIGYRYRFPVFDLSEKKMEAFLQEFQKKNFVYINGYTSSIVLFAKYLRKRRTVLRDICPRLKVCIVTSEMFFEEDKQLLEDWFGIPVINEYGASELGLLAFENRQREWILNSETMFVEIVDQQGRVLPEGEEGKIVVTSLYNKAHPFIRYEIGDSGIIGNRDNQKKRILQRLSGRTNDVAVLPSGKIVPGLAFYYVTKSIMENDSLIKEFAVRQEESGLFVIFYVSEKSLSIAEEKKITRAMSRYLEEGLQLIFEHKKMLNRTKRGKLKQFESLL